MSQIDKQGLSEDWKYQLRKSLFVRTLHHNDGEELEDFIEQILSQAIVKARDDERRHIMKEAGAAFVNWNDKVIKKG